VNRRHFLGQVAFGSAALAAHVRSPLKAAEPSSGLTVRFVGMMGFVERTDRSMLVALPGHHRMGHYLHAPFLMARRGSAVATALGLTPMPGVVAEAFDHNLAKTRPDEFVYRCLDGHDMDIASRVDSVAVDNQATQMAQMNRIAPGKRLRRDLRQWAQVAITVQGGRLVDAAAHPDAGKVWTFGSYSQRLTDAVTYSSPVAAIRLGAGSELRSFAVSERDAAELWVISAAAMRKEFSDPRTLEHGAVAFEYLADATPITAYCAEAEGRDVFTELPCGTPVVASLAGSVARTAPPMSELCFEMLFERN